MIEHGILTTTALAWVHLFPLTRDVYGYSVNAMRAYLRANNKDLLEARSRDDTITGLGYLAPRSLPFIKRKQVPSSHLISYDWRNSTQREFGMWGEEVVLALLNDWVLFPSMARPFYFLREHDDQFGGRDISNGPLTIEVKTESPDTAYLFVQHSELGHRANLAPDGTTRVTRLGH